MEQKARFPRVLQGSAELGFLEGETPKTPKVCVNPCISSSYTRNRISCRVAVLVSHPSHGPSATPETRLVPCYRGPGPSYSLRSNPTFGAQNPPKPGRRTENPGGPLSGIPV